MKRLKKKLAGKVTRWAHGLLEHWEKNGYAKTERDKKWILDTKAKLAAHAAAVGHDLGKRGAS